MSGRVRHGHCGYRDPDHEQKRRELGMIRSPSGNGPRPIISRRLQMLEQLSDQDLRIASGGTSQAPVKAKIKSSASLKIDGVDGESTDDKHKGEIQLESY
jgi:hypothetical protein